MRGVKRKSILCMCLVLLFLSLLAALSNGYIQLSLQDTFAIVLSRLFEIHTANVVVGSIDDDLVWYLRFPRFLLAAIAGAGLGLCGTVMQAVLKNPLADPYLLGVSSGAGLGAVMAIALHLGQILGRDGISLFAFVGALLASLCIIGIASWNRKNDAIQFLLAGMGINVICSAGISLFIVIAADEEGIQTITYWLMGSLLLANWHGIFVAGIVILLAGIFFLSQIKILNLMLWDDDTALTMGTNLTYYRRLYILVVAMVVGILVYYTGMIGFIGLIVPHIVRFLCGSNHILVLPFAMLLGACFVCWADVGSRTLLSGTDIPIGIMVSILGGPIFVGLLYNKKYGFKR